MILDVQKRLSEALQGGACRVSRREADWLLSFGEGAVTVSAPWRIVQNRMIALADTDDGQCFGLDEPLNAETAANALLEGRRLEVVELDVETADLRLDFGAVRLDVFNNSSGYEGWQARLRRDRGVLLIVGQGGGTVAVLEA